MQRSVTVGVDGSPASLAAADWGAREALRRGLPLRLLHAEPLPEASAVLDLAKDDLASRYARLPVNAEQVAAEPVAALLAAADDAEMLVLGSKVAGAVAGFIAGSVALAVVARALRPVVLVRAGEPEEDEDLPEPTAAPQRAARHREVVLGLDLAHPCDPVIEFAFDAAERRSATLRVIHTWQVPAAVRYEPGVDPAALERREGLGLSAALLPWRERFADVPVCEQLVIGRAAQEFVLAAPNAALLVVGRWTHRPAAGARLGPVTHSALHHAACPVAVVPHD